MATNMEMIVEQRTRLFFLLKLKKVNNAKGIAVEGLEELIIQTEAVMQEEDVAYVEKMVARL